MATLPNKRKALFFDLVAVPPVAEGPHNAYDLTVRDRERTLFQRRYTTYADSPDGHWNVWRLFRAMQMAETLAVSQTPFDLSGSQSGQFNEPATLAVNVGWLDAVLSADTLTHTHNRPEPFVECRSSLCLYLLTGPQELGGFTGNYQQFWLECEPVDLVAFGQTLEAECREALRLRRALGTLAPADEYIDD